jgi:hypothetical protein
MAFPTNLTYAVDGVTDVTADHLNNLEAKVGIDGSEVSTSLDYLLKNPGSVDPGHVHSGYQVAGSYITALTGDVAASGPGSTAATIQAGAVSLSKMANLAPHSIVGNNTADSASPLALSIAQVKSLLAIGPADVGLGNVTNDAQVQLAGSYSDPSWLTYLAGTKIIGFTQGYIPFGGASALTSDSGLFWDNTNKRLGIGTIEPTMAVGLGGGIARTIGMERETGLDTAGYALTLNAGGATVGATNKAGGTLILSSGISTGSGNSQIQFKVAPPWAAATSDNTATAVLSVYYEGASSLVYSSNNAYNGNSSVAYPFILKNANNSAVLYAQFGATNPVRTAGGETGQFKISCREAGGWNDRFFFKGSSFGIGTSNFGTSAVQILGIGSGTAPSSAPADMAQMWVADINGAAGYAGFHKRTETTNLTEVIPGVVIRATTGRSANPYEGLMEINQVDNGIYWYADGAWRTIATW